ncbi:transposable element Tcb2 transposase [Trichonephila clavipes]|nr:transposable element Tcb2 transposase [Trichonephila clavipes]
MQYYGVGRHHDQWPHARLHVVAKGTMTGQRYIDEVLLPHVRLFRGAGGDKFVFMDDNATCHRTLAVQDCLDGEGIQRLVCPVRSPDLNPIENVWDALGRQVTGRNYPPTNKNTLIRALTEEWDKLPQQLLDNVVQSMPQLWGKDILEFVQSSKNIIDTDSDDENEINDATPVPTSVEKRKIRFRLESDLYLRSPRKITLLNSRGGSTTHPSSFLIGRPTKVCTRPSDSLASYWHEPNKRSLSSFLNAMAPDGSSSYLISRHFVHHAAIVSVKPF